MSNLLSEKFRKWLFTICAGCLSALILLLDAFFDPYFFPFIARVNSYLAPFEIDVLIMVLTIFVFGLLVDRRRARYRSQLKLELEKAVAYRDRLFSIISHDLRSAFNGIIGLSKILHDQIGNLPTKDILRLANELHHASGQVYNLLSNLLKWAGIQTKTMVFQPDVLSVYQLVEDGCRLFSYQAAMKGISIKNNTQSDLVVFADQDMVATVLRNLLSNALKFTPSNGAITVDARVINKYVEVSVTDNGVGISPHDQEKLFDVGVNFTCRGTNQEKGTGLGLIICKEFVTHNGGQMLVESQIGKGSTFKFTLPLAEANERIRNLLDKGAKKEEPATDNLYEVALPAKKLRCLLVDDDPISLEIMANYLGPYGVCDRATNGKEALEQIRHSIRGGNCYDLICLDIEMPELDGVRTLQEIRSLTGNDDYDWSGNSAKVIMISAINDIGAITRCYQDKCWGYLFKPLQKRELLEKLEKLGLLRSTRSAVSLPS